MRGSFRDGLCRPLGPASFPRNYGGPGLHLRGALWLKLPARGLQMVGPLSPGTVQDGPLLMKKKVIVWLKIKID